MGVGQIATGKGKDIAGSDMRQRRGGRTGREETRRVGAGPGVGCPERPSLQGPVGPYRWERGFLLRPDTPKLQERDFGAGGRGWDFQEGRSSSKNGGQKCNCPWKRVQGDLLPGVWPRRLPPCQGLFHFSCPCHQSAHPPVTPGHLRPRDGGVLSCFAGSIQIQLFAAS